QAAEIGEVALSVRRLTREGVFTDVSFEVRRGESVGLAGLGGAGRREHRRGTRDRRPPPRTARRPRRWYRRPWRVCSPCW
ncbi:hypothetical protein PV392_29970, partial [Streptomyces sp. ME03-5709C]|nr:hypothetical protein [Streptomyces sp. ME03-5709C]